MCMVEDERGRLMAACSTLPREGMKIFTNTGRIRRYRKNILELLLADHCRDCTTCGNSGKCKLQELAVQFGIKKVRFENNCVFINAEQFFNNVPKVAWEMPIGGYMPAEKWLKDRKGRTLSGDDIKHYQRIVIALLKTGNYKVDERSLIKVDTDAPLGGYPYALNEVALLKYDNSSLISVATFVGGELLANYVADGLIICTPTGSTGYSISVGGPIIVPASHSLCISAVAPHSLSVRPVIVTDDVEIELHVKSRSQKFLIAIDGRSEVLDEGVVVRLRRADHTIRVLKVCRPQFFDTLRDKMQWGADQRLR